MLTKALWLAIDFFTAVITVFPLGFFKPFSLCPKFIFLTSGGGRGGDASDLGGMLTGLGGLCHGGF